MIISFGPNNRYTAKVQLIVKVSGPYREGLRNFCQKLPENSLPFSSKGEGYATDGENRVLSFDQAPGSEKQRASHLELIGL